MKKGSLVVFSGIFWGFIPSTYVGIILNQYKDFYKTKGRWLFQTVFFIMTPNLEEMIQFDEHIFQLG